MQDIFQVDADNYFNAIQKYDYSDIALAMFRYQYENNRLYREYVDLAGYTLSNVNTLTEIPFLPISFYKTHKVITGEIDIYEKLFKSSTTTGDTPSIHYVKDIQYYNQSILKGFQKLYGDPGQYTFLALLPSYLERGGSSLVYMVELLMKHSGKEQNGFYLHDFQKLYNNLSQLDSKGENVILIGVTYALLDFSEQFNLKLNNTIVIETGGMKGRRKEMVRAEVHEILKKGLNINNIHSEYGMTELFSQAYSTGEGVFTPTSTMNILVRDINDPMDVKTSGNGCLNIIDLSNIHSCAFIATDDIGKVYDDGRFEVQGRADNTMVRGCNLMVAQ